MYDIISYLLESISLSDAFSGAIGVFATLSATYFWRRSDKKEQAHALRNALQIELLDASAYYICCMERIGDEKQMLHFSTLSLRQNYTAVYDANAASIGALAPDTAAAVVRAYTALKTLTDMLNSYASVCAKYSYAKLHNAQDTALYKSCAETMRASICKQQEETLAAIDVAAERLS